MVAESATTFAKDTAAKTGIADRTIRENLQIAKNLSQEVQEKIKGTDLA